MARSTRSARKLYSTDIDNEEWSFIAPYLTLMVEDAPQRKYDLRELLTVHACVKEQTQRWIKSGCFAVTLA